jgi:hypothetical protein
MWRVKTARALATGRHGCRALTSAGILKQQCRAQQQQQQQQQQQHNQPVYSFVGVVTVLL